MELKLPFDCPSEGTWGRRDDLTGLPGSNHQKPYVEIVEAIDSQSSRSIFFAIFDDISGERQGNLSGVYNNSTWDYTDDFTAIYVDTNNNSQLDKGDEFHSEYDSGEDFGGLRGSLSAGRWRLGNTKFDFLLSSGELLTTYDLEVSIARQIGEPLKFKTKFAKKISDFDPCVSVLEIDAAGFGIDPSASFAAGKNKKMVKKKLSRQGFDFLYDQKKGGLYFNENGSDKGFGDGGIIAILKGAPDLTSGNLEFT